MAASDGLSVKTGQVFIRPLDEAELALLFKHYKSKQHNAIDFNDWARLLRDIQKKDHGGGNSIEPSCPDEFIRQVFDEMCSDSDSHDDAGISFEVFMETFNEYWTQRDGWLRNFKNGNQFTLHSIPKPRKTFQEFLSGENAHDDITERGKQARDQAKGNRNKAFSKSVAFVEDEIEETLSQELLKEVQAERAQSKLLRNELQEARASTHKKQWTRAATDPPLQRYDRKTFVGGSVCALNSDESDGEDTSNSREQLAEALRREQQTVVDMQSELDHRRTLALQRRVADRFAMQRLRAKLQEAESIVEAKKDCQRPASVWLSRIKLQQAETALKNAETVENSRKVQMWNAITQAAKEIADQQQEQSEEEDDADVFARAAEKRSMALAETKTAALKQEFESKLSHLTAELRSSKEEVQERQRKLDTLQSAATDHNVVKASGNFEVSLSQLKAELRSCHQELQEERRNKDVIESERDLIESEKEELKAEMDAYQSRFASVLQVTQLASNANGKDFNEAGVNKIVDKLTPQEVGLLWKQFSAGKECMNLEDWSRLMRVVHQKDYPGGTLSEPFIKQVFMKMTNGRLQDGLTTQDFQDNFNEYWTKWRSPEGIVDFQQMQPVDTATNALRSSQQRHSQLQAEVVEAQRRLSISAVRVAKGNEHAQRLSFEEAAQRQRKEEVEEALRKSEVSQEAIAEENDALWRGIAMRRILLQMKSEL
eukprot:gnl/MRDRNA2_/MRDRNA2_85184_c0_seq1.p1 gnl/MRDRNA2_/MRDRNA2_85184_c0~~gnl/MRDRNA2_/MRDRNA2_85184_c0_seq1.p1  ORF type:complete len:713 (+),score=191.55 gnl/MRDRNA2_/MRDRNA2_85184_c0_seq1:141-2279(+)